MKRYSLKLRNDTIFYLATLVLFLLSIVGMVVYDGELWSSCLAILILTALSPLFYIFKISNQMDEIENNLKKPSSFFAMKIWKNTKNFRSVNDSKMKQAYHSILIVISLLISFSWIWLFIFYTNQSLEGRNILDDSWDKKRRIESEKLHK